MLWLIWPTSHLTLWSLRIPFHSTGVSISENKVSLISNLKFPSASFILLLLWTTLNSSSFTATVPLQRPVDCYHSLLCIAIYASHIYISFFYKSVTINQSFSTLKSALLWTCSNSPNLPPITAIPSGSSNFFSIFFHSLSLSSNEVGRDWQVCELKSPVYRTAHVYCTLLRPLHSTCKIPSHISTVLEWEGVGRLQGNMPSYHTSHHPLGPVLGDGRARH